jgi:hypothetical protein
MRRAWEKENNPMGVPVVSFDLQHGRIFVGDEEQLAKLFKLLPAASDEGKSATSSGAMSSERSTLSNSNGHRTSVRNLARGFANRKLYEKVAVLFHYAREIEGRFTLTSRDLSDWFGLCGFKVPARMDKALDNLKRQHHIVQRTGQGEWELTAAGENVALDLLEPPSDGSR